MVVICVRNANIMWAKLEKKSIQAKSDLAIFTWSVLTFSLVHGLHRLHSQTKDQSSISFIILKIEKKKFELHMSSARIRLHIESPKQNGLPPTL